MSLCKRGRIWWLDIRTPQGERIRRTTETANKALAQEFHDRIKVELWRIDKLDVKPKHTWNDAVVRWIKETGPQGDRERGREQVALPRPLPSRQRSYRHQSHAHRSCDSRKTWGWASERDGQSDLGDTSSCASKMRERMGMVGSGALCADAQRADPAHSFFNARRGSKALGRVTAALGGHGDILTRDGFAGGECHRS